jgi:small subunit ribosomal protein S19
MNIENKIIEQPIEKKVDTDQQINKFELLRINRLKKKFIDLDLIKKAFYFRLNSKNIIKTKSRASVILPRFLNLVVHVYNGKKYIPILVNNDMLGHKFGEFVFTRKFVGHKKQNKKLMFKKKFPIKQASFSHFRVSSQYINLSKKSYINEKKN